MDEKLARILGLPTEAEKAAQQEQFDAKLKELFLSTQPDTSGAELLRSLVELDCFVAVKPDAPVDAPLSTQIFDIINCAPGRYGSAVAPPDDAKKSKSKNGKGGIAKKTYLEQVGGRLPTNLWKYEEVGHTDEAKKELMSLFDGHSPFDTPKPTRLLSHILSVASDTDTLVLDSFAGSGTTAHAVLSRNKADGGNRRFILVEMMDYADSITAERVKRVIRGHGSGAKAVAPTGGDFSFYELGEPLMLAGSLLNPTVPADQLRAYIWYTETQQGHLPDEAARADDAPGYLGTARGTAYYFHHDPVAGTTLDHAYLSRMRTRADGYVVYADRCTLSEQDRIKWNITFKKIPRDIACL